TCALVAAIGGERLDGRTYGRILPCARLLLSQPPISRDVRDQGVFGDEVIDRRQQVVSQAQRFAPGQPRQRSPVENQTRRRASAAVRDCSDHTAEAGCLNAFRMQSHPHDDRAGPGDGNTELEPTSPVEFDALSAVTREPQVDACQVVRSVGFGSYGAHHYLVNLPAASSWGYVRRNQIRAAFIRGFSSTRMIDKLMRWHFVGL